MPDFSCQACGKAFTVPEATLAKFPGWKPKQCMSCKNGKAPAAKAQVGVAGNGPQSGVFTDGAASPNPGPGGWGAVFVDNNEIIAEKKGHEPQTTNNRMELSALIAGYQLVPQGTSTTIYSDSELCVNTVTKWASSWKRNGWQKKNGEIKNLDLVKALYALAESRPDLKLQWIKAHNGYRWNEYADELATSYRR